MIPDMSFSQQTSSYLKYTDGYTQIKKGIMKLGAYCESWNKYISIILTQLTYQEWKQNINKICI